jgi:hypothetical protein
MHLDEPVTAPGARACLCLCLCQLHPHAHSIPMPTPSPCPFYPHVQPYATNCPLMSVWTAHEINPMVIGDAVSCPEKHTKSQATQHGCLPRLLNNGDKGIEIEYDGGKLFCTGPTSAAKAEQKSLVPTRQAQRTNQGRTPINCTL